MTIAVDLGRKAAKQNKTNKTFELDYGFKVIQNVAQYPLHHVTYAPVNYEAATVNLTVRKIHLQVNTLFDL